MPSAAAKPAKAAAAAMLAAAEAAAEAAEAAERTLLLRYSVSAARRLCRRHAILRSLSSKVLLGQLASAASAAANIAAAEAFAAAADFSDGNLGPDTNPPGPLGAQGGPGRPRALLWALGPSWTPMEAAIVADLPGAI